MNPDNPATNKTNELVRQLTKLSNRFSNQLPDREHFQRGIINCLKADIIRAKKDNLTEGQHNNLGQRAAEFILGELVLHRIQFPKYSFPVQAGTDYETPEGMTEAQKKKFINITKDIAYYLGLTPNTVARHLAIEMEILSKRSPTVSEIKLPNTEIILKHLRKSNLFSIMKKFNAVIKEFSDFPNAALTAATQVLVSGRYPNGYSAALAYRKIHKEAIKACSSDSKLARAITLEVFTAKYKSVSEALQNRKTTDS